MPREPETTELYRPSNGSECEWFMSIWCDRCVKDTPSKPCRILGRAMAFNTSDKEYPREWVHDAGQWPGNPRCTAFSDHVPAPLTINPEPPMRPVFMPAGIPADNDGDFRGTPTAP